MSDDWPFSEPESTEVITLDRILRGESHVRLVTHDADDGSWQYLDGEHVFEEDARVVTLRIMTELDSTLLALVSLPCGWYAWRDSVDDAWHRYEGECP